MRKYDSYKECVINTPTDQFSGIFTTDWTFREIESWMLDTYSIDKESVLSMTISSVTIYKTAKHA